ncbi:MAG: hypothetical protein LBP74_04730, partial [Treponema sp.]|nr:hypothetical protein [Treponema sp.]
MKKICVLALFFVLSLAPCMAQDASDVSTEQIIVYRLPDPERLYIYRNGLVVYDAKIPGNTIISNAFILPENIQLDSLTISQAGTRIYSYSTELVEVLVVLQRGERPNLVKVLRVHIPELEAGV